LQSGGAVSLRHSRLAARNWAHRQLPAGRVVAAVSCFRHDRVVPAQRRAGTYRSSSLCRSADGLTQSREERWPFLVCHPARTPRALRRAGRWRDSGFGALPGLDSRWHGTGREVRFADRGQGPGASYSSRSPVLDPGARSDAQRCHYRRRAAEVEVAASRWSPSYAASL
jgi:hypothetical protein